MKSVVNFRIYTVQMMLINRCSFITFAFEFDGFEMMGLKTIKIIIPPANINEHLLCVRHFSQHFKSHSQQPYKIAYRWENRPERISNVSKSIESQVCKFLFCKFLFKGRKV